jgi:opacity protein-like surface antigen
MKKLLLAVTAVSGLAVAAPAAAQQYSNMNAGGGVGINNRILQLDSRLRAGVQAGVIDQTEARDLRQQLRSLRDLEARYSANGLTQQERSTLQQRIRSIRQQMRLADGGRFDRDTRYSWDDRYDEGYANNGYRNETYRNDGYGQGGPYDEVRQVCGTSSGGGGIAGVIGSILGSGRDNCLTIGERVPSNLGAVPYELRDQFRDGYGYYHRYVNGNVIQIDSRTNTVARIYDVR